LPRLRQTRPLWGGSLAFTRRALAILDLPQTIGRTLTEDLPIGDRAAQTGLRVLTRRAIRPLSPLEGGFGDLWRFGRRQYQLIRLYRPGLWGFAALVVTSDLAARIALLATAALPVILVLGGLGSIAAEFRMATGKRLGDADGIGFRVVQHFLVWALLPIPVFHASVIWGGFVTSPVVWRHVRYIVDKRGHVTGVVRRRYPDQFT
jgi:hypothetical protein